MKTLVFLISAVILAQAHDEEEVVTRAIVHLEGGNVTGKIIFEALPDGNLRVVGKVVGMPPGSYGFHIHEKGDITGGCHSTGEHFNPHGHDHGHPDAEHRHVGDLGNLHFDKNGIAIVDFNDHQIKLSGEHNIIGRAAVLRSEKDDFGAGEHHDSKKDGHTGERVACGVIGIA